MKVTGEYAVGRPADEIEALKQGDTWVPSLPQKRTQAPMAYPLGEHGRALTDSHLASLETIRETATPTQRAWAVFVRLLPWMIPWLVICFGILYVLDDPLVPLLVFAGLTAVTVYGLNQQEYTHSAAGVERHKADLAHDLQRQRDADDSDRKDKLVDAYVKKMLEE